MKNGSGAVHDKIFLGLIIFNYKKAQEVLSRQKCAKKILQISAFANIVDFLCNLSNLLLDKRYVLHITLCLILLKIHFSIIGKGFFGNNWRTTLN